MCIPRISRSRGAGCGRRLRGGAPAAVRRPPLAPATLVCFILL